MIGLLTDSDKLNIIQKCFDNLTCMVGGLGEPQDMKAPPSILRVNLDDFEKRLKELTGDLVSKVKATNMELDKTPLEI